MSVAKIEVISDVSKGLAGLKQMEFALGNLKASAGRFDMAGFRGSQNARAMEKGIRGSGQGMLQLAYFADDAQYGMKGIMNNIPGMVQGFGGSAKMAGILGLTMLAVSKIMDGSVERWMLKFNHGYQDQEKAIKEMGNAARDFDAKNIARIEREQEAYRKLYEERKTQAERIIGIEERYQEIKQQEISIGKGRTSEQMGREQSMVEGFLSNRSQELAKPGNLDFRLKAEQRLADIKKRQIDAGTLADKQSAESKLSAIQTEVDQRKLAFERAKQAEIDLAKIIGDKDNESVKKQMEASKEAQKELTISEQKKRMAELELHEVQMMGKERLLTAEQDRKLRLDAIGEEMRLKAESDFQNAFQDAAGQTTAIGTQLQRVGLGKTPELVMQVDLARRSEKHLSDMVKQLKKLSFGLN